MKRLLTKAELEEAISAFPRAKVLVIGDLMLDEFIWGDVERISPEAPVPVVWVKRESFMPGGAANVARNITSLGGQAIVCGIVGKDPAGKRLKKMLEDSGVDTAGVVEVDDRPTTVKTRVVAHSQQVVRIDREDPSELDGRYEERLLKLAKRAIDEATAVIIEDYGKGVITRSLLSRIIPYAHKQGKIVSVDPKKDHFSFYRNVDVITPNRKELGEAVGKTLKTMADVDRSARALMRRLSLRGLLVTLSELGMKLYLPRRSVHIPTTALEVYDVSGAGDTVIASFTLARAIGLDPVRSAVISNISAGVVVGKVGVATCSVEELRRHFEEVEESVLTSSV